MLYESQGASTRTTWGKIKPVYGESLLSKLKPIEWKTSLRVIKDLEHSTKSIVSRQLVSIFVVHLVAIRWVNFSINFSRKVHQVKTVKK